MLVAAIAAAAAVPIYSMWRLGVTRTRRPLLGGRCVGGLLLLRSSAVGFSFNSEAVQQQAADPDTGREG